MAAPKLSNNSAVENIPDTQMTNVSKDFFFEGMPLPVTIYIRMRANTYLTIGRQGEKATFSELHSFNHPDFRIYLKTLEHSQLINYVTDFTGKIVNQEKIPASFKGKFLTGLTEDALKAFDGKGFSSAAQMHKISKMMMSLAENSSSFDQITLILEQLPPSESKHSVATCMISLALCDEMQVTHGVAQEKVALASLLHDVGLKAVPQTILQKARHLWTPEELAIYEQHPIRGVELLRDIKDLSSDVLLIIAEHHENSQGTGYPKRLRDVKVSPLGKIVSLGNYFAELMFSPEESHKYKTADVAIHYIEEILGQPFNRQAFMALKNIVNKKALADKQDKG